VKPSEGRSDVTNQNLAIQQTVGEFVTNAYGVYGKYVLEERAVADFRDGFKPVQRRIAYSMFKRGVRPGTNWAKSAETVGHTMGTYHAHGDAAIYGSMVSMVWDRYPTIQGQGNFGSSVDPPAASRYCVVGDTLIDVSRGLLTIEQLQGIDCTTKSFDSKQEKILKWLNSGVHDVFEVITRCGFRIVATPNEPLFYLNTDLDLTWKTIDKLSTGDYLCINRGKSTFPSELQLSSILAGAAQKKILPSKMTPELGAVLGYLISEGSIGDYSIEFINKDRQVIKDFETCWAKVFPNTRLHKFYHSYSNCIKLEIHSRHVVRFLHSIGLDPVLSGDKIVPWSILQSDLKSIVGFMSAYFEGDGGVNYQSVGASSKSRKLLEQIQLLLLKFGILSRLVQQKEELFQVYISTEYDVKEFLSIIGFRSKKKQAVKAYERGRSVPNIDKIPHAHSYIWEELDKRKLNNRKAEYLSDEGKIHHLPYSDRVILQKLSLSCRDTLLERAIPILKSISTKMPEKLERVCTKPYLYDEIISIKPLGQRQVFDLTVENTHAYTGNGFICHNTETRLSEIAMKLFECIDVGEFVDTYTAKEQEPLVLPTRAPILLLNGSSGIAVGLSQCIPPHYLTEVVNALRYVLKAGTKATLDGALEHLKGPDYGDGVLISSPAEIKDIYEKGEGTLYYKCKYTIENIDDESKVLVITGFAPNFNLTGFINKIEKLVDEGLLPSVPMDGGSEATGIRYLIPFENGSVIQDRVIPELYTSISYRFWVHERKVSDVQIKWMPFMDLARNWLAWRETVERQMLELEKKQLEDKLFREEAKLAAILNLKVLTKILDTIPVAQLEQEIVKQLGVKPEQAKMILDMIVAQLAKGNSAKQQTLIQDLKTKLAEVIKRLKDIKNEVDRELKALLPLAGKRGTLIEPEIQTTVSKSKNDVVSDPSYIGIKTNGQAAKWIDSLPVKGKGCAWDWLLKTKTHITTCNSSGVCLQHWMSYVADGNLGHSKLVGVVSSYKDILVAVDSNGSCGVIDNPQNCDEYQVMKLEEGVTVKQLVGLTHPDQLWIWTDSKLEIYPASQLETTRKNCWGASLIARATGDVTLTVVPAGGVLVDRKGNILDAKGFMKVSHFFVVGDSDNFVVWTDGTKAVGDLKTTISWIKQGGVETIIPIDD
jgi:DNA gyrase subunit A